MQLDITIVLRCFETQDIEDTARSQNVGSVLVTSQRIQQCFYLGIKTSYCKGKKGRNTNAQLAENRALPDGFKS